MSDVTELIAAIAAIAKDPDTWVKRLGDVRSAAEKLAEARTAERNAEQLSKHAAEDLETARYERGQVEHANREKLTVEQSIIRRDSAATQRERELDGRDAAQRNEAAAAKAELDRREAALTARETAAEAKLKAAQELMADYDAARHAAALKLAS